jgi:hypothetical protein
MVRMQGDEWMGSAGVSYACFALHLARRRAASN